MNNEILPKISINKELIESIVLKDKESASYIQKNIIKAEVLIKSIEERKKTFLRILEKILIKQESFFENGESYLKPMTIKEISEERAVGETYVKRLIKEIIEKEDKTSPVSDQEISDRLLKNTLHISRRTVAKYREQMRIISSNKRKKKLQNKKNI